MHNPCVITCYTCTCTVWEGGRYEDAQLTGLPFGEITGPDGGTIDLGDGHTMLTVYADTHCAREDCPHTTVARSATESLTDRVTRLEQLIAEPSSAASADA